MINKSEQFNKGLFEKKNSWDSLHFPNMIFGKLAYFFIWPIPQMTPLLLMKASWRINNMRECANFGKDESTFCKLCVCLGWLILLQLTGGLWQLLGYGLIYYIRRDSSTYIVNIFIIKYPTKCLNSKRIASVVLFLSRVYWIYRLPNISHNDDYTSRNSGK